MIFYHFTTFWALDNAGPEAVLRAGLKAGPESWFDWTDILAHGLPALVGLRNEPEWLAHRRGRSSRDHKWSFLQATRRGWRAEARERRAFAQMDRGLPAEQWRAPRSLQATQCDYSPGGPLTRR